MAMGTKRAKNGLLMKNDNPCPCCKNWHGKDVPQGRRYYRRVEKQRFNRDIRNGDY